MEPLAIIFFTLNSPMLARYSLLSYVARHLRLRPLTHQSVTLALVLTLLAFYQDLVTHLLGPNCPFLLLLGSILQAFACAAFAKMTLRDVLIAELFHKLLGPVSAAINTAVANMGAAINTSVANMGAAMDVPSLIRALQNSTMPNSTVTSVNLVINSTAISIGNMASSIGAVASVTNAVASVVNAMASGITMAAASFSTTAIVGISAYIVYTAIRSTERVMAARLAAIPRHV